MIPFIRPYKDQFSLEVAGSFLAVVFIFESLVNGDSQVPKRLMREDLPFLLVITSLLQEIVHDIDGETGMVKSVDAHVVTKIIDEEIKGYLQGDHVGTLRARLMWFIQKVEECVAYLMFQVARDTFLEALKDQATLQPVLLRINNIAADVEAGKYSLRDVSNLVSKINEKLGVLAQSLTINH